MRDLRPILLGLGLGAVVAGGCRKHEAVCGGSECVMAMGAVGGERSDETAAGAGAGGDPAPDEAAPCVADVDCDNGVICDGAERCTPDGCEAGTATVCEDGTSCEPMTGECRYGRPSPWLLVVRSTTIEGLPTDEIGKRPLLSLWTDPHPQSWTSIGADWVPDGHAAIACRDEGQFTFSYWNMRFGPGRPEALRPLRDVPNSINSLSFPEISPDSRYALTDDPNTGIYLTSLVDDAPTRLLGTPADGLRAASFCPSPGTWLESYTDKRLVAALDGNEIRRRERLTHEWVAPSRTGHVLVSRRSELGDPEAPGVLIETCSFLAQTLSIPDAIAGRPSPDGSLALLSLASGGQRLLRIEDLRRSSEVLSGDGSSIVYQASFSSDGRRILARRDGRLVSVDLEDPRHSPAPLYLDEQAQIVFVDDERELIGSAALLAWQPGANETVLLVRQDLAPVGAPMVLASVDSRENVGIFQSPHDPERVFVAVRREGSTELFSVRLDSDGAEPFPLLTVEGSLLSIQTPGDGSGLGLMISDSAYWAAFKPNGGIVTPIWLGDEVSHLTVQPWP